MYKLLVAEDEKEIRTGLSNYFPWSSVGFEVAAQAENGLEVLSIIDSMEIDVILSDIKMPIMDGLTLCKELSKRHKPPVMILLTGHRDFDFARQAIDCGVKKYLLKPTDYQMIIDVFTQVRHELDEQRGQTVDREIRDGMTDGFYNTIVNQVKEYIATDIGRATLEGASGHVHMSTPYLSKLFKTRTGVNFCDYLIGCKIQRAKEMLVSPGYKIYEIGELLGYTNANNFSRRFKEQEGITPYQYRARQGKELGLPAE